MRYSENKTEKDMEERGRKFRLNTRQRERLFYGSLAVLALFVFLFVGSREPVLFDDSGAYMRIERFEGVMPIYPFFLFVNQWLFGMDTYLDFVILEQALFSTVCIVFFVKEIKNKFSLCYIEGYFVTKASDEEKQTNYEMYYDYKEKINQIPSHRILAINRGEKEEALKVKLDKPEEKIIEYMEKDIIIRENTI